MRKKFTLVFAFVIAGVVVGALLGFGPLLKYKSEGLLNMPMGTVDYKKIDEFAHNSDFMREFFAIHPPEVGKGEGIDILIRDLNANSWIKPVPSVSKTDVRDLPSLLAPRDKDKDGDKDNT